MKKITSSVYKIIRKLIVILAKIGITAVLIIWLVRTNRLDLNVLNNVQFDSATVLLLILGFTFIVCALLLLGYRLWVLIRYKRFCVAYKQVFLLTLVGAFTGTIFPGLLGNEGVKALYLCSNVSERRMDALTSIFIDRLLGLYSLLLLGSMILTIAWFLKSIPLNPVFLAAPVIVVLITLGIMLISWDALLKVNVINNCLALLPNRLQSFLKAFHEYIKSPKIIVIAVILSLLSHICVVGSFIVAAYILNDHTAITNHFIINPFAMVLNAVPLTPGGIGITESAFSFLFESVGSPNGAMIGLLGRFIQYIIFIVGGIIGFTFLKIRRQILTLNNQCITS